MKVGVAVGLGVRVKVEVAVGIGVRVDVDVGVEVGVRVKVDVRVGVWVRVGVRVGVKVWVGVFVIVGVSVYVGTSRQGSTFCAPHSAPSSTNSMLSSQVSDSRVWKLTVCRPTVNGISSGLPVTPLRMRSHCHEPMGVSQRVSGPPSIETVYEFAPPFCPQMRAQSA